MKKLVLITGGAGFIGSHTADALAKKGYAVRILDNLQSEVHGGAWPSYLSKKYERIRGDVREKKDVAKALRGASFVYHMAAYQDQRLDFSTFFTTNTVSTALIYECIVENKLPVKKIILASSQFVYGDGECQCRITDKKFFAPLRSLSQFKKGDWNIKCPCHGKDAIFSPFREGQEVLPTNSYGLSKKALEDASLRLGETYGIPTTCFRYSIVQGARQSPKNLYSGVLRIFVSQALAGVPITVYEDGKNTRDFVNIHDVVAANLMALANKKTDFEIFNVGGGRPYSVLGFAQSVKKLSSSKSPIVIGGFRRTDTRHAVSDISKLKRLGWRPLHTPENSVREYIAWYKKEGFAKTADIAALKNLKAGISR